MSNSDARSSAWFKGEKAKPFKNIMAQIAKDVGGYKNLREFVPIGGSAIDLVNDLKLTRETARRLLDAQERVKKNKERKAHINLMRIFDVNE